MRMLFQENAFSLKGSYDVFDDAGAVLFQVRGKELPRHTLEIRDGHGVPVGTVREKVWTMLTKCSVTLEDGTCGMIRREKPLRHHCYGMDFCGWTAECGFSGRHCTFRNAQGTAAAQADRVPLHLTDRYVIDVDDPKDAVKVLLLMLAIEIERAQAAAC